MECREAMSICKRERKIIEGILPDPKQKLWQLAQRNYNEFDGFDILTDG